MYALPMLLHGQGGDGQSERGEREGKKNNLLSNTLVSERNEQGAEKHCRLKQKWSSFGGNLQAAYWYVDVSPAA